MKIKAGDAWCELDVVQTKCRYQFFGCGAYTSPIGGEKENADCVEGFVQCRSTEDAEQCMVSIAALLENGYGEHGNPRCWYVALDMNDIVTRIFNGEPMHFAHKIFASSFDLPSLREMRERVKDSAFVFCSFTVSPEEGFAEVETALGELLSESEGTEIWYQISVPGDESRTLDVWYR
ncbi:MAG: hypothetical protein IKJ35_04185 [Clostridia bacterium]|nr:hypothetical protein [Clostridia bacterium]